MRWVRRSDWRKANEHASISGRGKRQSGSRAEEYIEEDETMRWGDEEDDEDEEEEESDDDDEIDEDDDAPKKRRKDRD